MASREPQRTRAKTATEDQEPRITELRAQKMAVVRTVGDPQEVSGPAVEALYGAVYRLRSRASEGGRDFSMGNLRARWPNANVAPRNEWIAFWALPIPNSAIHLPSEDLPIPVKMEVWVYGMVAEILHIGPYAEAEEAILRLHEHVAEHGYEIAGPHEEEYLTPPDATPLKTIIRYPIRAKLH